LLSASAGQSSVPFCYGESCPEIRKRQVKGVSPSASHLAAREICRQEFFQRQ
jgi:hypothetical protein